MDHSISPTVRKGGNETEFSPVTLSCCNAGELMGRKRRSCYGANAVCFHRNECCATTIRGKCWGRRTGPVSRSSRNRATIRVPYYELHGGQLDCGRWLDHLRSTRDSPHESRSRWRTKLLGVDG